MFQAVTQLGEALLSAGDSILNGPTGSAGEHCWFAVQTKARHEKKIAAELTEKKDVRPQN